MPNRKRAHSENRSSGSDDNMGSFISKVAKCCGNTAPGRETSPSRENNGPRARKECPEPIVREIQDSKESGTTVAIAMEPRKAEQVVVGLDSTEKEPVLEASKDDGALTTEPKNDASSEEPDATEESPNGTAKDVETAVHQSLKDASGVEAASSVKEVVDADKDVPAEEENEEDAEGDDEEDEEHAWEVEKYGYSYIEGRMLSTEGHKVFNFTTQRRYEEIGDAVEQDVFYMLKHKLGLVKKWFRGKGWSRFAYASHEYTTKKRIMVLVHGSGVVKAGQWARKLIMNESLRTGTMFEYIEKAQALDWGVVVLNYNNKCDGGCRHDTLMHGKKEWSLLLPPSLNAELVVVAHSAGGYLMSTIYNEFERMRRVKRLVTIALTDSWFNADFKNIVNFCASRKALKKYGSTWEMFSGGDTHEATSAACIDAAFHLMNNTQLDTNREEFVDLLIECEQIIQDQVRAMDAAKKEKLDAAKKEKLDAENKDKLKEDAKDDDREREKSVPPEDDAKDIDCAQTVDTKVSGIEDAGIDEGVLAEKETPMELCQNTVEAKLDLSGSDH